MWRSKVLLALIIYFAGFATAIYYLAPADANANVDEIRAGGFGFGGKESATDAKSEEFAEYAEIAGASMRKFVTFAEEKAVQLGEIIKKELAEQKKK